MDLNSGTMSKKQKRESLALFDEEEEEADDRGQLAVNKNYADRYNDWRGKEEMQKCRFSAHVVGFWWLCCLCNSCLSSI